MKNKFLLPIVLIIALVLWAWVFYWNFSLEKASANPDYICVKDVSWNSCDINTCDEWSINWERTCYWTRVTQIAYYNTRTSCESWYVVDTTWSTKSSNTASRYVKQAWYESYLDSEWRNAHNSHPSSWRHSRDYPSQTESCFIVEVDTVAPIWSLQIDIED